jgi:hypothetical protein
MRSNGQGFYTSPKRQAHSEASRSLTRAGRFDFGS